MYMYTTVRCEVISLLVKFEQLYEHDKSKQGKYIHPEQLSLFSKKKLPWMGFEPTTLRVLGERYSNTVYIGIAMGVPALYHT